MVRREQHKCFHEWVLSASSPRAPRGTGIGKLHRHVNSPNVARSLCQVSTEEGVLRSTPSALVEVREAAWAKRWQRDTADFKALVAELVSLRAQAFAEDVPLLDPVTVDKLDQTLRRIPDNTGLGCGCVEPRAIKHAPVDAKQDLCFILDSIIRTGVLPWDLLYVIIALLPKDGAALGGERPIFLLPTFVRIPDRLFYDELSAWCDAAHGFWDRAIANSSALRSAIHSNLMMETAHIMGISAGILFIDLQKFYDSVDLVLLMRACGVLGYPRISLLLLVQTFLGPRTLRADGHHSNEVPVSNGLVAGSSQANHLARAFLHRALHDHHNRCRKLAVSQFVDDLKMYTEGTTRQVVYRCSQATVELFHSVGKLKVDLPQSKCGFVATTRGIALTVCSGSQQKDFGISSTKHAHDLGVDVSFGNRAVPFGRKRASRACIRSGRIRCFAKNHQRACRLLFKGRALPQSTYGHQIWGIPPTAVKRLRAAAAWTSGGYRAGMCTTTLHSINKTEPASRLHLEVITGYLVCLRDHPLLTKRIERSWQLLLWRFAKAPVELSLGSSQTSLPFCWSLGGSHSPPRIGSVIWRTRGPLI